MLGETNPKTLGGLNELAVLYLNQGKYADAEPLFAKVLDIRRRTLRLVPLDPEPLVADTAAGPERQALSRAALRELANLVSGLPEQQRSAVVLRCVQGMTYAEVAAQLALLYLDRGQKSQARKLADEVLDKHKGQPLASFVTLAKASQPPN